MKSPVQVSSWRDQIIVLIFLVIAPLVIFAQVAQHDYVSYDDGDYVYENRNVQQGFTAETVKWAFTTGYASNWHPVTWLSHMLDWQIYGKKPGRPHFTNVLFHIANTLLLFGLLRKITGAMWRSAFVAALFALHPLHVESVAWLAERKDVLSTFFGLLTVWFYAAYTRAKAESARPVFKTTLYFSALVLFALGLMSKPMLVTLPFVLLLLDFWPLGRISGFGFQLTNSPAAPSEKVWLILLEKLPFLLLTAVSSYITFKVQEGKTMQTLSNLSIPDRVSNVLVSYTTYLEKMIWPSKLAFFYPLLKAPPLWLVAVAALFLVVVTGIALRSLRRFPFLATGWFWYLGMLVPVIGIVHVGEQSHADRYTYLPLVGIFIAVAWFASEAQKRWQISTKVFAGLALLILVLYSLASFRQVGFWKNNHALLERALAVTKDNYLAHNNYGVILANEEKYELAMTHYEEAIRLKPQYARAYDNYGSALTMVGKLDEAVEKYSQSLALRPDARAQHNLAVTLARQGKYQETILHCREALRLDPNFFAAHFDLALALSLTGNMDEAASHYESYLKFSPEDGTAHSYLATILEKQRKFPEAISHYRQAIQLQPETWNAYGRLAWILATNDDPQFRNGAEAVRWAERAVDLTKSQNPAALLALAAGYAENGQFDLAVSTAQKALSLTEALHRSNLIGEIQKQLQFYQAGKPFHEPRQP